MTDRILLMQRALFYLEDVYSGRRSEMVPGVMVIETHGSESLDTHFVADHGGDRDVFNMDEGEWQMVYADEDGEAIFRKARTWSTSRGSLFTVSYKGDL